MNAKKELLEALKNLSWHKDTDTIFQEIYDAVQDYMRETKNNSIESVFDDYIHIWQAEQRVSELAENDGLLDTPAINLLLINSIKLREMKYTLP